MTIQQEAKAALIAIDQAKNKVELEKLRLDYLGKKGSITIAIKKIGALPTSQRAKRGAALNQARTKIEAAIEDKLQELQAAAIAKESERPIDLTAPAKGSSLGHFHPIRELEKELVQIFWQLGFAVAEGPEIESDWYNFEALNIPVDHPARDMQDTFYLTNGAVARTHTSPVQIRYMENHQPPIRIIAPGKVYRNEDEDATHLWAFNQLEGLVVDKAVTLADLKGTLDYMMKALFGDQTEVKFLPSYFPYTEPSLEVHARINKDSDWVEMAGAGMVHPQVLKNVGIDPAVYSGFAFGAGIDRLATIRHQVTDIRNFWRPDLRFLEQF